MNAPTKQRARPRDEALAQIGSAFKGAMASIRRLRGRDTHRPGELSFARHHRLSVYRLVCRVGARDGVDDADADQARWRGRIGVDLNRGLVSSLYNLYAAVPSMHIGYGVTVGASLLRYGRHRLVRTLGALYPLFVLVVVVATGNHFFFDAAIGALVAALAEAAAARLTRRTATTRLAALSTQRGAPPSFKELAA